MKLADALLRRKELNQKVDQVRTVKEADMFQFKFERKQVTDSIDDIKAAVPVCEFNQVTQEYDYYANKLRLIDAAIQQLNWTTDINVDSMVWKDFPIGSKVATTDNL